jgi:hypothetical protein
MHPATVQPRKVPVQWITLPLYPARMLSFLMFVPDQPLCNPGFQSTLTRFDDLRFFSNHLFPGTCSLFELFSEVASFVFSNLQPLFAKHPGWGVLLP